MKLTVNTDQVDATLALKAYNLYKGGLFGEATQALQEILDVEPRNWQARLFLAVCFSKTDQPGSAQRSLRFVYDNCTDANLRKKAFSALQLVNAALEVNSSSTPPEFESVMERMSKLPATSIDLIVE